MDFNSLDTLEHAILEWSHDKEITTKGNALTQCLKLVSEVGELADNILKGKNVEDDIGDCLIVLTNLSVLCNTTLLKSGNIAYNDIKSRNGALNSNGSFIKNKPSKQQLKLDMENLNDSTM